MEIKRQKEIVHTFHYDLRHVETEIETELKVNFSPIKVDENDYPQENSMIIARLEFQLVFEEFVLSGAVSQINHLIHKQVRQQSDLKQHEVDEIVAPLFDIVKRMTYEVTEIALDQPGIQLDFQSSQP